MSSIDDDTLAGSEIQAYIHCDDKGHKLDMNDKPAKEFLLVIESRAP